MLSAEYNLQFFISVDLTEHIAVTIVIVLTLCLMWQLGTYFHNIDLNVKDTERI